MAFGTNKAELRIIFTEEEEEIPANDLSDLLAVFDKMYTNALEHEGLIEDISPTYIDQRLISDYEARDTYIGQLVRYKVYQDILDVRLRPLFKREFRKDSPGLQIKEIRKESPLVITLTGGGIFIAVLWIISGIDIRYETTVREVDGERFEERITKIEFNATSTRDLIEAIREIL